MSSTSTPKAGFEDTKLEGAKFVLKSNSGRYYRYDESAATKAVTGCPMTRAQATEVIDRRGRRCASFAGLASRERIKLEETAAPAGYNQLTEDITIVLADKDAASVDRRRRSGSDSRRCPFPDGGRGQLHRHRAVPKPAAPASVIFVGPRRSRRHLLPAYSW